MLKTASAPLGDYVEVRVSVVLVEEMHGWKFKISEILNFRNSILKLAGWRQKRMISSLNDWLCFDNLKTKQRSYYNLPNSAFWG